ncbi:MAG TPA: hypothetical protein VH592_18440 [Gemmataceae bacterium]|jgi:hypothetical protein
MPTLPSAIDVSDSFDGEVRYRLPQRPIGRLRYVGLLPMAIGLFIVSWPILGIVFFLTAVPAPAGGLFWFAVLGPLLMFGPVCFPLGGFIVFKGLLIVTGHTEISLRADRLYLIDRCGWFRWTRRPPVANLRGFRVEHGSPAFLYSGRTQGDLGLRASLKADLIDGKSLTVCQGYPHEWLLPLAEDLARRCQQVVPSSRTASGESIRVVEICTDPSRVQDRPCQPTNSTAILESQPDGLTITIPPAGLVGGSGWFFVLWCLGWNSAAFPFAILFLCLAIQGEAKWQRSNEKMSVLAACLFMAPFLVVGIGSLFALLHRAWRRTVIAVAGDSLQIVESGLLGTRRRHWSETDLLGVGVRSDSWQNSKGNTRWTISLTVQSRQGGMYRLLSYREKAELEWIATVLRQALRLPSQQRQTKEREQKRES